jgi:ABC-2 type transport system permease protein
MSTIWLVIRHEIRTTLRKRSFWIMTVVFPLVIVGGQVFTTVRFADGGQGAEPEDQEAVQGPSVGLVDRADLIREVPDAVPEGVFIPYESEEAARQALDAGDVDQYVVIPSDYLSSGEVLIYDTEFQLFGGTNRSVAPNGLGHWMLQLLLTHNLVGEWQLTNALFNPTPSHLANHHQLRPPDESQAAEAQLAATLIAQVLPFLFFFVLVSGSGYLLQSVTAEKESRTAEVLLLSLSPRGLMMGKLLGLGVVIFLQLGVWFGSGALLLTRGAASLNLSELALSPTLFVWAGLYLVFGFLLFGSVMAAGGAIAPNAREGGQLTWILVLPLMPTLMFASEFAASPNGTLATVLSFIPFSAPSAMVTRLAVTDVPLWQPLLSLAGLAVTSYAFTMLAARFFRADNLLSGAGFSWGRFAQAWRSR